MQTFHQPTKQKQVQTQPVEDRDTGIMATTWDMYDTYKALEESSKGEGDEDNEEDDILGDVPKKPKGPAVASVAGGDGPPGAPSTESSRLSVSVLTESSVAFDDKNQGAVGNTQKSQERDEEEEKRTAEVILNSGSLKANMCIMERVVTRNIYQAKQALYRGMKILPDPDLPNDMEEADLSVLGPNIERLWTYGGSLTKSYNISCMTWNKKNPDILAVGYGEYGFTNQKSGMACCWSIKNPEFPERVFKVNSGVTALDFSKQNPNLLAVGMYNGTIAVYNVRSNAQTPILDSNETPSNHLGPVWEIKWIEREYHAGEERTENIITTSTDGKVTQWMIRKGFESVDLMKLKRVGKKMTVPEQEQQQQKEQEQQGGQDSKSQQQKLRGEAFISLNKKLHPLFIHHLLTLTLIQPPTQAVSGLISSPPTTTSTWSLQKKDLFTSVAAVITNSTSKVTLAILVSPVYKVKWSPFVPDCFLTCSSDWTIRLWHSDVTKPILTFVSSTKSVNDICWSNVCATVFGAVSDNRIEIWDLRSTNLDPVIISNVSDPDVRLSTFLFTDNSSTLLVGDSTGHVTVYQLRNIAEPSTTHIMALRDIVLPMPSGQSLTHSNASITSRRAMNCFLSISCVGLMAPPVVETCGGSWTVWRRRPHLSATSERTVAAIQPNNNRGGYNQGSLLYYEGNIVNLERTNQHSCGDPNNHCEVLIPYMCGEFTRDGTTILPIPERRDQCEDWNIDPLLEFGMHENYAYYRNCKNRDRNEGLFTADQVATITSSTLGDIDTWCDPHVWLCRQNLRRDDARSTRQNPNGQRRGYECPEERDYYPYWSPTPWMTFTCITLPVTVKYAWLRPVWRRHTPFESTVRSDGVGGARQDIAVITNNASVARCEYYKTNSENVLGRFYCKYPDIYFLNKEIANQGIKDIPITKAECEATNLGTYGNGQAYEKPQWVQADPFGIPAPECIDADWSRDNHNGNGIDGFPLSYNWTVPSHTISDNCALRLRYNITTGEFAEGGFDPAINDDLNGNQATDLDVATQFGLTGDDVEDRGYVFEGNPQVEVFADSNVDMQLAINTAQYGRTFQDRTHVFAIRKKPEDVVEGQNIYNLNVRGKRGNIVQTYPAVEYDFQPNRVQMKTGDYIHIQWTGSDTNPNNNDGQGRQGTDRSNMILLRNITYDKEGALSEQTHNMSQQGQWASNYPIYITNTTSFLGLPNADIIAAAFIEQTQFGGDMEELDDAGTYYNMGLRRITDPGVYNYMSTRNNNFSNRSQKGKIVITQAPFVAKKVGVAGGEVALPNGEATLVLDPAAISEAVMFYLEATDSTLVQNTEEEQAARRKRRDAGEENDLDDDVKTAGDAETGDKASSIVGVFPLNVRTDKAKTHLEMAFEADAADTTFVAMVSDEGTYASLPSERIEEMGSGKAKFRISSGGKYQVLKYPYVPVIIAFCILAIVLAALFIGMAIYFKQNPDAWYRIKKNFTDV
eukprot:sb/3479464/